MGKQAILLKQSPRLETSLHISQVMIASLELLAMPSDELYSAIEKKVDENPALSFVTHNPSSNSRHTHLVIENQLVEQPSLFETIMKQARDEFSKKDLPIAEALAGNINEKGFLEATIDEIKEMCNVSDKRVNYVLKRFHLLDPIGVGATDAKEALLIQARKKKLRCAEIIIRDYYDLLLKKRYKRIGKELDISQEEVEQIVSREIKSLYPFPARGYDVRPSIVRRPEMKITHSDDKWIVTHAFDDIPELKITPDFTQAADPWKKERAKDARKFIDAIAKRKALLIKIVLFIAERQKDYVLGSGALLNSLQLTDLAEAFDVSPSTISRAIANKSIETPRGLLALHDLFSRKVDQNTSKQKAMLLLKQLMENTQTKKTDAALSQLLLKMHDIKLSRRTVAKYRQELQN